MKRSRGKNQTADHTTLEKKRSRWRPGWKWLAQNPGGYLLIAAIACLTGVAGCSPEQDKVDSRPGDGALERESAQPFQPGAGSTLPANAGGAPPPPPVSAKTDAAPLPVSTENDSAPPPVSTETDASPPPVSAENDDTKRNDQPYGNEARKFMKDGQGDLVLPEILYGVVLLEDTDLAVDADQGARILELLEAMQTVTRGLKLSPYVETRLEEILTEPQKRCLSKRVTKMVTMGNAWVSRALVNPASKKIGTLAGVQEGSPVSIPADFVVPTERANPYLQGIPYSDLLAANLDALAQDGVALTQAQAKEIYPLFLTLLEMFDVTIAAYKGIDETLTPAQKAYVEAHLNMRSAPEYSKLIGKVMEISGSKQK